MATRSTTPFFGRAYSLSIALTQGDAAGQTITISSDEFEPNALRFSFELEQHAFSDFWHAEITIYNCDGPIGSGPNPQLNLFQAVIQEGDIVTLRAGYQADYKATGVAPTIWQGPVFYFIKDRLDVVDQRLILHCVCSRALTTLNFINGSLPALSNQVSQARYIAANSITKIGVNSSQVQGALASTQLPRGVSFFGAPHNYLQHLADSNSNVVSWFDSYSWNLDTLKDPAGKLVASYAPIQPGGVPARVDGVSLSLIGTPQQTQFGVNFRVLLDPVVQVSSPLPKVGLAKEFVRQAPVAYPLPKGQYAPRPLGTEYIVVGVRCTGDTRGNAWYTDITGLTLVSDVLVMLGDVTHN